MPSFFRYDNEVQTPLGAAVPGASIAVLTQPATLTTQPGSPLATLYAAPNSNSATVTAAVWAANQIQFTLNAVPADVVPGSSIFISGASPAGFNSSVQFPWLVLSVAGLKVFVQAFTNPGAWVSGGTVASSALPNPTLSDGNGHFFFYAAAGIYTTQIFGPITEQDYLDQGVGTAGGGGGGVSSVGLALPAELTVSGSPVTTSGTLTAVWANETANKVFSGPSSGGPAIPGFRVLAAADIPSLPYVSSVAFTLAVPSILTQSVGGSPVTASGTIAATIGLQTQAANTVLAGPTSGGASTPTFRGLVTADFPGINLNSATLTLSAAQVKALRGTPVQIVAAPPAGQVLVPVQVFGQYKFGTTGYTNTASAILIVGASGLNSTNAPLALPVVGWIDQLVSTLQQAPAVNLTTQNSESGAALFVSNVGGAGELATGDGTVTITVWYFTITLT